MAIHSIVDDLADVPEALHEDYEEQDGKYVLRKSAFEDHPAWKKLKGTLNALDRDKREAEKKAARFDALSELIPEEVDLADVDEDKREKAFKYLAGELELEQAGGSIDVDALKAQARKPIERDLQKAREESEHYKSLFTQTVRDQALTEAMAAVKIADPYRPAVKAMFKDRAKVEVNDSGVNVLIDGEYGPMDAPSFFKEWAQTEQGAYFVQAPNNTGGGARGGNGSGKQPNPFPRTIDGKPNPHYSLTKAAQLQREQPDVARRMAKEAGWSEKHITW